MSQDSQHQALIRAKSYPYTIPSRSYIIADGTHRELSVDDVLPDVSGRRPVLAVGSIQSPEQLLRKFNEPDCGPIPVIQARLCNFDVVYSPHVATYGAIPATLAYCPGTVMTLFINWLTPEEESRMHETEVPSGNYHFGRLDGIELQLDRGRKLTSAFVYCSRRGYWSGTAALSRSAKSRPKAAAGHRFPRKKSRGMSGTAQTLAGKSTILSVTQLPMPKFASLEPRR